MEATEIQVHQLDGYIVRFHFNAYLIHHRVLGLGDELLNHSNAFTLLPKSNCCDVSISLTLIHQFTLAWIKLGRLEMAKKAIFLDVVSVFNTVLSISEKEASSCNKLGRNSGVDDLRRHRQIKVMRKVRSNEKTKNGLLASPSGRVNDISMEDNTEIKDGLISPIKGSKSFSSVSPLGPLPNS
uniref:Uncharacterized protein n=1 Tax=Cucumis melo TaxID=3656 RepID=A0A9I9EFT5_CUCME